MICISPAYLPDHQNNGTGVRGSRFVPGILLTTGLRAERKKSSLAVQSEAVRVQRRIQRIFSLRIVFESTTAGAADLISNSMVLIPWWTRAIEKYVTTEAEEVQLSAEVPQRGRQ